MEKLPSTLQFLPPTKTREKDPVLRMMCIEILLLLSTSELSEDETIKVIDHIEPKLSPEEKRCDQEELTLLYESYTR